MGGDPFDEINLAGGGGDETQMVNRRNKRRGRENPAASRFRATLESVPTRASPRQKKEADSSFHRSFPSHKRFPTPCSRMRTARIDESELCRDVLITSRFSSLFHVEFLSLYYYTPPSHAPPKIYRRRPAFRHAAVDSKDSFANLPETLPKIEPRFVRIPSLVH